MFNITKRPHRLKKPHKFTITNHYEDNIIVEPPRRPVSNP